MPYNSIVLYAGQDFSIDHEVALKARLKRLATRRESQASVLIRLLVNPDPELWIRALDDCFPDETVLSAFIVKMIAAHPGLAVTIKTTARSQADAEAQAFAEHRNRVLEAVESFEDVIPANRPITEQNLETPYYSPDAIEARLKRKLGDE